MRFIYLLKNKLPFLISSLIAFNCSTNKLQQGGGLNGYEVGQILKDFSLDYHLIEFYYANWNDEGTRYYVLSKVLISDSQFVNDDQYIKIEEGQILDIKTEQYLEPPEFRYKADVRGVRGSYITWNHEYIVMNDTISIRVYSSNDLHGLYVNRSKLRNSFF